MSQFQVLDGLVHPVCKSHSDENVGSKGLSVPEICLFLRVHLYILILKLI